MLDINPEELLDRIYNELMPGDWPHHRSAQYREAILDVERLIRKMVQEKDEQYDKWANEQKDSWVDKDVKVYNA